MDRVLLARLLFAATTLTAIGLVVRVSTAPLALQSAAAPDVAHAPAACTQVATRPRPDGRCGELHDGLNRACDALRTDKPGAQLDVDAAMLQLEASGCWGGES